MGKTIWHCHIAMSLDGKIARADGSFGWLESYPPQEFGFDALMAGIDAILMGRDTYEVIRGFGDWPHGDKPTIVMTNRPLVDPPRAVEARAGDLAVVAAELEARGHARVWVEGGAQVIRGMIEAGKLDVLEMAIVPIVLGDGIPLIAPGTPELKLTLKSCEPRGGGALHVVCEAVPSEAAK
jgi:dihydrofolate reductase